MRWIDRSTCVLYGSMMGTFNFLFYIPCDNLCDAVMDGIYDPDGMLMIYDVLFMMLHVIMFIIRMYGCMMLVIFISMDGCMIIYIPK